MPIIKAPTLYQYEDFMKNGGQISYVIDTLELSEIREFEEVPVIKASLHSGFELGPNLQSKEVSDLIRHGNIWNRIVNSVYSKNGKITYKKLSSGNYQANCSI